jgi:HSP20 family protein
MTLLTKASHLFPDLSSNLMDFFNEDRNWPKEFTSKMPAVNISEDENSYHLALAAPGLEKDDFEIAVDNQRLTIGCEKKREKEEEKDHFTRKEFSYESFSRSFMLPDSINSDEINASYENGVLTVALPKKEPDVKMAKKQISVG